MVSEARSSFLLLSSALGFISIVDAFLCQELAEHNWDSFLQTVEASPELVILCPFEITGKGCPSSPMGYEVPANSSLTILCDHTSFLGGNPAVPHLVSKEGEAPSTGCVLDCPGTHFTVRANAKLTIDGLIVRGSTKPAIAIEPYGELQAFETKFEKYVQDIVCTSHNSPSSLSLQGLDLTTAFFVDTAMAFWTAMVGLFCPMKMQS